MTDDAAGGPWPDAIGVGAVRADTPGPDDEWAPGRAARDAIARADGDGRANSARVASLAARSAWRAADDLSATHPDPGTGRAWHDAAQEWKATADVWQRRAAEAEWAEIGLPDGPLTYGADMQATLRVLAAHAIDAADGRLWAESGEGHCARVYAALVAFIQSGREHARMNAGPLTLAVAPMLAHRLGAHLTGDAPDDGPVRAAVTAFYNALTPDERADVQAFARMFGIPHVAGTKEPCD